MRTTLLGLVVVAATTAAIALTVPASQAETLSGPWAPFSACPVDNPEMLGAPANTYGTTCVASTSPNGTFQIGGTALTTGSTDVQFGISGAEPANTQYGHIIPATDGQTLVADPVDVPGGLLGLIGPLASLLHGVNGVTATVELAGTPTNFDASGTFGSGAPLFVLPVKIHLTNLLLGPSCYIGSDSDPIVLEPAITSTGAIGSSYDADFGIPIITLTGATMQDDSFAVPGATGCGPLGLLNGAVDAKEHLPSPAGANKLVLNDVNAALAFSQDGGQKLADAWHAHVVAP